MIKAGHRLRDGTSATPQLKTSHGAPASPSATYAHPRAYYGAINLQNGGTQSGSKVRCRAPQWRGEIGGRHRCSGLIGVGRDMNTYVYQIGREGPL